MNNSHNKRILVCAHDRRLISNLEKILATQQVDVVSSGSDCLSAFDEVKPDILLLQMFLSDMDAFDLLAKISEKSSCSPTVVLFTSAHPGAAAEQFTALHVAGTILKSAPMDILHEQLQPYFNNELPPLAATDSAIYISDSTVKASQYLRIFEQNTIQAYPVESSELATNLIRQVQPSFILFEIETCLGQIFPILEMSRSIKVPAGLIAISQLEDVRLHNRMLESGVHCILNEPVSDEQLTEAIHSVSSLRKAITDTIETPSQSILVVEDAPDSARTIELLLREHGYNVTLVESAEDAMALMPTQSFNLLLLDLRLPGMGGVELLARMRHSGSRIPCVVVTGSQDQKDRRLLGDLGVQAIFDKPANYETVTNTIGELICET